MRLALPLLLLATTLLAACGGGGGDSGRPGSSPAAAAPDTDPVAVSGHFFSYVSDGSQIYAVDRTTSAITAVATLAVPTEKLDYLELGRQRGLLAGRTIEWQDLLYVDKGKLYLLPARSETATAPTPRQLSAMDDIDTACGKYASVSADGQYEGLLFFRPDPGQGCYGNSTGHSYLITTDMSASDVPVIAAAEWQLDMAIAYINKGRYRITGFLGIRGNKLVRLDTAHQVTAVLKEDVASIDYSFHATGTMPDRMFVSLTSTGSQRSHHLLQLDSNTLLPDLGPEFSFAVFAREKIYSLYNPWELGTPVKAYFAAYDGSAAQETGCSYSSGTFPIHVMGDVMLAYNAAGLKTLNLETCEEKTVISNPVGDTYYLFMQDDSALYFNALDKTMFHRVDLATLADSPVAQARISGSLITPKGGAGGMPNGFILLGNLDRGSGDSQTVESLDLEGNRLLLGTLDSDIADADASFFFDNSGHTQNLGIVSFQDGGAPGHSRLYSINPKQAGSLTLLLEKNFLQQL